MTRFIDKSSNIKFQGINDIELGLLIARIKQYMGKNKNLILIIIDNFEKSKDDYGIFELSDEFVIVLRRSNENKITINIGYPFPIFSKVLATIFDHPSEHISVSLYVRGEPLRKLQRRYLKNFMKRSSQNLKWVSVNQLGEFRNIVADLMTCKDKIVYIDPYHFIGDSFTGLFFAEQFQAQSRAKKILIISKYSEHLNLFYRSEKDATKILNEINLGNAIIVMPDLIDNHFGQSLEILGLVRHKDTTIFIPGRNLIVSYQSGNSKVHHYNINDILLRNKNVEDYMIDCIDPFFEYNPAKKHQSNSKQRERVSRRIFFNPYSSNPSKEIPTEFFLEFAKKLAGEHGFELTISKSGESRNGKNTWLSALEPKIRDKKYKKLVNNINFLHDENIADLMHKLQKLHIGCALTSDTCISHALSKTFIPNITIYNERFWDKNSLQSLSAESPLGFCRYNLPQFAAIKTGTDSDDLFLSSIIDGIKAISNGLRIDQKKFCEEIPENIGIFYKLLSERLEQSNGLISPCLHKYLHERYLNLKLNLTGSEYKWLFSIYDPDQLIRGIISKSEGNNHFLIFSAWKNLPLYKFLSYFS